MQYDNQLHHNNASDVMNSIYLRMYYWACAILQDCQYTRVCNATAMVGMTQYLKKNKVTKRLASKFRL